MHSFDDVDWFVPHQANGRIIHAAAQKLGQPLDKFQISIKESANVSSATVPMALYDLQSSGKLQKGDIIAVMGFGGGLCCRRSNNRMVNDNYNFPTIEDRREIW